MVFPPATIPLHSTPDSSAHAYFSNYCPDPKPKNESDLLRSIRIALRGSESQLDEPVHAPSPFLGEEDDAREGEHISWNDSTVILMVGGVISKRWNLEREGQPIQWACIGRILQEKSRVANRPVQDEDDVSQSGGRPSFGPFARAKQVPPVVKEEDPLERGVFVFMKSVGKIFLSNGLEFTFSIPFIVGKAWPASPHGVIIQRLFEPNEREEAEANEEPLLPTFFGFTGPFTEAVAIGVTSGIHGSPPRLADEDEDPTKALKCVPPADRLVWVSVKCPSANYQLVVTVDEEKHELSVWRYIYIKPKDSPIPLKTIPPRPPLAPSATPSKRISLRRTSSAFPGPMSPSSREPLPIIPAAAPIPAELPPLSALPGLPPTLTTTTTMESLMSDASSKSPPKPVLFPPESRTPSHGKDLSLTMDRMVLGGARLDADATFGPIDNGRMRAAYWVEKLYAQQIDEADAKAYDKMSVALYDHRWDGETERSLLAVCLPSTQTLALFSVSDGENGKLKVTPHSQIPSITSVAPIRAMRSNVWDLLVAKAGGASALLTHGTFEMGLEFSRVTGSGKQSHDMNIDEPGEDRLVRVETERYSDVLLTYKSGAKYRAHLDLVPQDELTVQALQVLALALPPELSFQLHATFTSFWTQVGLRTSNDIEFGCLSASVCFIFGLGSWSPYREPASGGTHWQLLGYSASHRRMRDDPALKCLKKPPDPPVQPSKPVKRHDYLGLALYALHTLAENLRLSVERYQSLFVMAPLICKIALVIRPEWADYWRRFCPRVSPEWPSTSLCDMRNLDDRIPVWPPDISAILYGRISNPEWKVPWYDATQIALRYNVTPSFAFGRVYPLDYLAKLTPVYKCLSDSTIHTTQERAQNAVLLMTKIGIGHAFLNRLPLGVAAPLREAMRTCQLAPPSDWPVEAYDMVGREDVAASARRKGLAIVKDGYKPIQEFINPSTPRRSIEYLATEAKSLALGEQDAVSGVEMDFEDFSDIRFGQDRRLDEVARMLCSSCIPSMKMLDRPELSEHDQAKEQQAQVLRIAERTLALPYGRAMFTYGSIPALNRELYSIPKLEFSVRLQPLNVTVSLDPGKILPESLSWGEFHNGVAAGLRISPSSTKVESSWVAFQKPNELTPEHAGLLFGLGLTGHLRRLVSWHTFSYLTPKHDLTSIGLLLGLAAANVGNGNRHVTKLLSVHMPAMLPTPDVDLNVSLMTQAAGMSSLGLLYLGTKNRRMAEVCLSQMSRKDLIQPDLSNEYREAYTFSSALAFGMITLGKGSTIPADVALLERLQILLHGDTAAKLRGERPTFDINLTSPAASIAIGLMYLRTERQDIADLITIPNTVLALNQVQPTFLLLRTLSRALIMWNTIIPSQEWVSSQIPTPVMAAIEARFKHLTPIDDALELAYYNIISGCCFAVGLKFAGTARQEAYKLIIRYYDMYTRMIYASGPNFDSRIKRSAIREGLNLISIALSLVMAGTGEISCFRRLRYAYGMYQQTMYHPAFKYGIHVATHLSIGLLFLGGGRFTLGTSDAAIACMVTAFFPRFHTMSADNKSYLQALRHLWVLAVEPRCLIARDVQTNEVVYLPLKIAVKDQGTTQLVSPTLIPDIDRILYIRVDTPRYWPFNLDIENNPQHKESLLHSQTLYVKRRTAFLSYTEDPRGSRSLFVRSRSSAGEAATLDYPQLTDTKTHPAGDLSEFITSFSNDALFLAFADHFARPDGRREEERLFQIYCHAALYDAILQGKAQSILSHLTLFRYRYMSPDSKYFHLHLQDLRFAADFYSKIYERRFSGRSENNYRVPLIRDSTVSGVLHVLDEMLDGVRAKPEFLAALGQYARGETVNIGARDGLGEELAWYLLRNSVPVSTLLVMLQGLAKDAFRQCLGTPSPAGTTNAVALDRGIKEVLHAAGTRMTTALGTGWAVRSLEEVLETWKDYPN